MNNYIFTFRLLNLKIKIYIYLSKSTSFSFENSMNSMCFYKEITSVY